jgi:hypothetical protein
MSDLAAGALIAGVSGIVGTLLGVLVSGFQANRMIDRQERLLREERRIGQEERQALQRAGSPPGGE